MSIGRNGGPRAEAPVLDEPAVVLDIFATRVSRFDHGSYVRIVFSAAREGPYGPEEIVVARIVMTREEYFAGLRGAVTDMMESVSLELVARVTGPR